MRILATLLLAAFLVSACAPTIQPMAADEAPPSPTLVAVDEADGVDLRIEVEEGFVGNALSEQLAEPIPVPGQPGVEILLQDTEFDLVAPDLARVTTSLNADVYGIEAALRPTISLKLSVVDGQIQVDVADVSLGRVQFPLTAVEEQLAGVEETVRTQVAGALQQMTDATGLGVVELVVTQDALVLDLGR